MNELQDERQDDVEEVVRAITFRNPSDANRRGRLGGHLDGKEGIRVVLYLIYLGVDGQTVFPYAPTLEDPV